MRFRFAHCVVALCTSAVLPCAPVAATTPLYTITDIGPGTVTALNNRNQATGYSADYPSIGWLWEEGALTNFGADHAFAINEGGVMGGATTGSYPVIFSKESRFVIDDLPLGSSKAVLAINDSGDAVGHGTFYVWEYHNGKLDILDHVSGQLPKAMAINNSGQVLVYSGYPDYEAIQIYDPGPGRDNPRTINVTGQAYDMNDSEQVVGRIRNRYSLYYQAFLWQNDAVQYIEGAQSSEARSVNSSGQVVGEFRNFSDPSPGFTYWHGAFTWQNGVFTDLQSVIPTDSGWDLGSAWRVNDLGYIVGTGRYHGEYRSFMLNPTNPIPEPPTWMLVASAGLALAIRRANRRA